MLTSDTAQMRNASEKVCQCTKRLLSKIEYEELWLGGNDGDIMEIGDTNLSEDEMDKLGEYSNPVSGRRNSIFLLRIM